MKPTLHFFRTIPDDLGKRPPLASSLQSFESSLISVRHRRFPEALIQCITAWESALKSYYKVPDQGGKPLWQLEEDVLALPEMKHVEKDATASCRKMRNSFIHFGYMPRDDADAAEMLLKTGYPFLEQLYQVCFGIDLAESLIVEVGTFFRLADEIYEKSPEPEASGLLAQEAFGPLAHLIRLRFDNPVTTTDLELIEDDDLSYRLRTEASSKWASRGGHETTRFSCPVCGDVWFDAIWQGESENDETYSGGVCFACEFVIPRPMKWLTERLLSRESRLDKFE